MQSQYLLLTSHNGLYAAFGASPSTIGGVKVTVVSCRGSQAVHLTTQHCESLVVFLWGVAKQLLHKQDIVICPYYTGPLKLYRCAGNSFRKSDLRGGGHCGGRRQRVQHYSKGCLCFIGMALVFKWAITCHGQFNICALNRRKLKDLHCDLIEMSRSQPLNQPLCARCRRRHHHWGDTGRVDNP